MAATAGVVGFNTSVYVAISAVYTLITEPKDVTGPSISSEFADFTHQQSPSGFRERKATFKTNSEVSFRCNFVHTSATHQYLVAVANANPATLTDFRLIFPDNSVFELSGYVSLNWTAPLNGPLEMAVTISCSGAIGVALPSASKSASVSASASAS